MKTRTKVMLGVVAVLVVALAGARAAHRAKWHRWVAAQEASFQQARLVEWGRTAKPAKSAADVGASFSSPSGAASSQESAQHDHAQHGAAAAQQKPQPTQHEHAQHDEHTADAAMSGQHHEHMEAHMRWTAPRAESPEDLARAGQIVETLRSTLDRYKDYKAAVEDGYIPFLPNVKLPMYHFTNYQRSIAAAFSFDPARPSSLLYRKHDTGYELIGVMYTAPRRFSEDQLDQRVPLAIARWHQHVNICLPSGTPAERAAADWSKFGPAGSIATESACKEVEGRWVPVLFGWMVHVYPFEQTREKIWTH